MNQVTTVLAGILFNLMFSHVQCTPAVEPNNAVVKNGDSVIINCSSRNSSSVDDNCSNLDWKHFRPGASSGDYICRMGQVHPSVQSYISAVKINGGYCNLKINATSSAAGIYQCVHSSGSADVELVVLEKSPACAIQKNDDDVITAVECSVHYSGNLVPKLQWMKLVGDEWILAAADENKTQQNYVSSSILTTKATSLDLNETSQHFKCNVTVSEPGKEDVHIYNWTSLIFGMMKINITSRNQGESVFIVVYSNVLFGAKSNGIRNLICQDPGKTCNVHCERKGNNVSSSGHSDDKANALASCVIQALLAYVILYSC